MKKIIRLSLATFLLITFFSCKKNYVCYCSYQNGTGDTVALPEVIVYQTNKNAINECANRKMVFPQYPSTICVLK